MKELQEFKVIYLTTWSAKLYCVYVLTEEASLECVLYVQITYCFFKIILQDKFCQINYRDRCNCLEWGMLALCRSFCEPIHSTIAYQFVTSS